MTVITNVLDQAKPRQQEESLAAPLTSTIGERLSRRCGRLYSAAYARDRRFYTPAVVNQNHAEQTGTDITSLFV
jgi:hypothetical protein